MQKETPFWVFQTSGHSGTKEAPSEPELLRSLLRLGLNINVSRLLLTRELGLLIEVTERFPETRHRNRK